MALGQQISELWIAFGMRQRYRFIPVHAIENELGPSKGFALPEFHALTGCNTTLAFFGKDKNTAWSMWQPLPELTVPRQLLSSSNPTQLCGVYAEEITTVNATRLYIFQHKGNDNEHMPPSSYALHQHFLRVAYQSGQCVWGNTLNKYPGIVSPTNWRW